MSGSASPRGLSPGILERTEQILAHDPPALRSSVPAIIRTMADILVTNPHEISGQVIFDGVRSPCRLALNPPIGASFIQVVERFYRVLEVLHPDMDRRINRTGHTPGLRSTFSPCEASNHMRLTARGRLITRLQDAGGTIDEACALVDEYPG